MNIFKYLLKNYNVDSYGKCFKNMAINENKDMKVETFSSYLFAYVPENSNCKYYHSEKLYDAFAARTVPIYLGSKTILEKPYFVDPHSFIWGDRPDLLSHLTYLSQNETAYNEYLTRQKMFAWNPSVCGFCDTLRQNFLEQNNEHKLKC